MRLVAAIAVATALFAQEGAFKFPTVRAHGTATVTAKPDQVRIDVGVVSQAQTAQAATAANAKQTTEVLAELKKAAGSSADIRTASYSVTPNYKYAREGGSPAIMGYTATNIVQVTTPDVTGAGKIIDAATRGGSNVIQGIHFSLKDDQLVRAQALRDAAKQARASAESMAGALGMKVLRVVRVEDSGATNVFARREMAQMRMAADAVATPVEPGTIEVNAVVLVTAEIGQ